MSTQIGTATDYVDLLKKLDAYLCATGHAWGKRFTGVGNGDLIDYLGTATSVAETFTLTATNSTTFTVVGSVSGSYANATVGTPYSNAKIAFTITAGATPYQAGDVWTINVAPPWTRLMRRGWADIRSVTTDLVTPSNLFDGSNSNATSTNTTSYIEFRMEFATPVRRIYVQASGNTANRTPTSFELQWKDAPGDPWTTVETFTKASWTINEGAIFTTASDPGAHLYWRINMSGATTSTEINAIELRPYAAAGPLGDTTNQSFQCAWEAPGLDGTQEIIVMAKTVWSQTADIWNVAFAMSRSWAGDTNDFTAQPGFSAPFFKSLLLGTNPMSYWFVVNGQRAIVTVAFGGTMQIAYLGFGLPYEPPSAHAYPAICAATTGAGIRYSDTNAGPRFPIDPGYYNVNGTQSMIAYFPDSNWRQFANRSNQSGTAEGTADSATTPGKVWPAALDTSIRQPTEFLLGIDGSRAMIPCVLLTTSAVSATNPHAWGEFDGLYWTTGNGATPQSVVRYENFDHLLVNNVYRTAANNYGAVRLD